MASHFTMFIKNKHKWKTNFMTLHAQTLSFIKNTNNKKFCTCTLFLKFSMFWETLFGKKFWACKFYSFLRRTCHGFVGKDWSHVALNQMRMKNTRKAYLLFMFATFFLLQMHIYKNYWLSSRLYIYENQKTFWNSTCCLFCSVYIRFFIHNIRLIHKCKNKAKSLLYFHMLEYSNSTNIHVYITFRVRYESEAHFSIDKNTQTISIDHTQLCFHILAFFNNKIYI